MTLCNCIASFTLHRVGLAQVNAPQRAQIDVVYHATGMLYAWRTLAGEMAHIAALASDDRGTASWEDLLRAFM